MPTDDGWDWPYLYYMGTVILSMTDAEFWTCSPRRLAVLTRIHAEVNNPDGDKKQDIGPKKVRYIDEVLF